MLGEAQYPTIWLPVGLSAAVVLAAAAWPGERFTRVVVVLCLIALVVVGYMLLPQALDVDQIFKEAG
jgi:ABC-type molybdate transport system permease subunit